MDSSIPSRNLNTRMTSEEMIDRSSEWTLGCDNALLNRLKDFSNSLVSQAEGITKDCDTLSNEVNLLQSRVESVTNDFLMLANTQYVENLVEEFEERNTVTPITNKSEENRVKTKAEKEAELIARMKEAIQIGLKTNSDHRVKTEIAKENEEVKIKRSHLIGTPKFFSSRYCGLVDENKTVTFTSPMPDNDQANFSDHSGDFSGNQQLRSPRPIQESESDLDYRQGYPSSGLAFRREGSMSSDDLSYGKVPVSTSSSSSIGVHPQSPQVPSNLASTNTNTSSNLVSDLNNALRSRIPPPQIESDESDDDFKPPPPGQGRKLFADPDDNEDDFFGSSGMYPANRYVDNDDDDFFDPPPKPAISNSNASKNSKSTGANPPIFQINNPIREHDATATRNTDSPPEIRPVEAPTNPARIKTQVQSNPAHDFSAVINQIKSVSNIKDKTQDESRVHPAAEPPKILPTSNTILPINNDRKIVREPEPNQPPPEIVKVKTTSNILAKESQDFGRLSVPPPVVHSDSHNHRQRKVKQSIFDDSDSDDIFSSASSSSSKRKDGKLQNKDNLFTASSRSLSSNGGGSSLFGGDEPEDSFQDKNFNRSSNDSIPNETVKPLFGDISDASKTQKSSKEKVKKSIFDDSDSDDDLFSSKRSKVIGKPKTSLFEEPVVQKPIKSVKNVSKTGPNSASFINDLDENDGDLFGSKPNNMDKNYGDLFNSNARKKENNDLVVSNKSSIPSNINTAVEIKSANIGNANPTIVTSTTTPLTKSDITQTNGIDKDEPPEARVRSIDTKSTNLENIFEPIQGRVDRLQSQEESEEDKVSQNEKLKPKQIPQSNSFVKNAALNLKINPLALKPGAKPPSTSAKLEEPSESDVTSIATSQPDPIISPVTENRSMKTENLEAENSKKLETSEHRVEHPTEILPKVSELFSGRKSDDVLIEKSTITSTRKEAEVVNSFGDDIFSRPTTIPSKPPVNPNSEKSSTTNSIVQAKVPNKSVPPVNPTSEKSSITNSIVQAKVPNKSAQTKNSVFDDSDSDGDLFTSSAKSSAKAKSSDIKNSFLTSSQGSRKEIPKPPTATVGRSRSLFNDDDDSSDLFAEPKHSVNERNIPTKPVNPTAPQSEAVVLNSEASDSKVPSSVSVISQPKIQAKSVKVKKSIFDDSDSDDDDLFKSISTKKSNKVIVEQKKSQPASNAAKNSLFTDEAEDDTFLFNPRKPSALTIQTDDHEPVSVTSVDINSPNCPNVPTSPGVNLPASPPGVTTENATELNDDIDVRVRLDTESSDADQSDEKPTTGMTNVKKLGLSLNINPLALRPGSKPSTPTADEAPCTFGEMSAGSESLLTGVVKNRVKIGKRRRLPTRKPPSAENDENLFGIPPPGFVSVDASDQAEPPDCPDFESSSEG